MKDIPQLFKEFWSQILYFIGVPSFFIIFVALYRPLSFYTYLDLGRGIFTLNVSICTAIVFGVLVASRLAYYYINKNAVFTWLIYTLWCILEWILVVLFSALYITLMSKGGQVYFEAVVNCLGYFPTVLIYPYAIVTLILMVFSEERKNSENESKDDGQLMRFFDENQRLKLVIDSSAVLYIEAKQNYVHIYYMEGDKLKMYSLRNSMSKIEQVSSDHGLVRCHRSYYINPSHVKLLGKDSASMIYAEIDIAKADKIPVSKRYYAALVDLL